MPSDYRQRDKGEKTRQKPKGAKSKIQEEENEISIIRLRNLESVLHLFLSFCGPNGLEKEAAGLNFFRKNFGVLRKGLI